MFLIQKPYKEEWESDKQVIYFPVHITQEYEAQSDVKKATADVRQNNALFNKFI